MDHQDQSMKTDSIDLLYEDIRDILFDLDIYPSDEPSLAVLLYSCEVGDLKALEVVLQNSQLLDLNLNDGGEAGVNALMRACQTGHHQCVSRLLQSGCVDVNMVNSNDKSTALMLASMRGHAYCLDILLSVEGLLLNAQDQNGLTALRKAMSAGQSACVQRLLATDGVNPNLRDVQGGTALMKACTVGDVGWVDMLMTEELDVNATNNKGWTALMFACHKGHGACVARLIEDDAIDVNAVEENGVTALILACKDMHHDCLEILLKSNNIEVNQRSHEGINALDVACFINDLHSLNRLLNVENIDVNGAEGNGGESVLILACQNGLVECVERLLDVNTIDVNATNASGITPLMAACRNGHVHCIDLLLKTGRIEINKATGVATLLDRNLSPSPYKIDWDDNSHGIEYVKITGCTALMIACAENNLPSVARLLLEGEAVDVNAGNDNGLTALMITCYNNNKECLTELLNKAVDIEINLRNCNEPRNTALFYAVGQNSIHCLRQLVQFCEKKRILLDLYDGDGMSALLLACVKEHVECLDILLMLKNLKSTEVNALYKDWANPLMIACSRGNLACQKRLLDYEAIDVNMRNSDGITSLHLAAERGLADSVRLLMLSPKIDTSSMQCNGKTAFMFACFFSFNDLKVNCAKHILSLSLVPNLINLHDKYGRTALHWASYTGYSECVRWLAEMDAVDVNVVDEDGMSPLMDACTLGYTDCVFWLTRPRHCVDVEINMRNKHGMTALMLACENGADGCAEILMDTKNVDINATNNDHQTALMLACMNDYVSCVRLILNNNPNDSQLNMKDTFNNTALAIACQYSEDCMNVLLDAKGVDVNIQNNNKETPLIIASRNGMSISNFIIDKKTVLNAYDYKGRTFVHYGYMADNPTVSSNLFHGTDVDITIGDKNKVTLLMIASLKGDLNMLCRIKSHFKNFDERDRNGWNAVMYSSENGSGRYLDYLCQDERKYSMKATANSNNYDIKKMSPLMLACLHGNTSWVESFFKHVGNEANKFVNESGRLRRTPLMMAVSAGHTSIVDCLLRVDGIDINATDAQGNTALMFACRHGWHHCVDRLLLGSGLEVDLNATNEAGWTALMFACRNGRAMCASRLLHIDQTTPKLNITSSKVNLNCKTEEGLTAQMIADKFKMEKCSEIMFEFASRTDTQISYKSNDIGATEDFDDHNKGGRASVVKLNQDQYTLMRICQWGQEDRLRKLILNHYDKTLGADFRYAGDKTALMYASEYDNLGCVRVMVEHACASVDAVDKRGWTALMYASSEGNASVVDYLIVTGKANANVKDINQVTPLMLACLNGHCKVMSILLERQDIKDCLDTTDINGWDALTYTSENGHIDCLLLLLRAIMMVIRGDKWDSCYKHERIHLARDKQGMTAFMRACLFGHCEMVKSFLYLDHDLQMSTDALNLCHPCFDITNIINETNHEGMTPFMLAALAGQQDIVDLLLQTKDSKVSKEDYNGETALTSACTYGNTACVEKIVQLNNRILIWTRFSVPVMPYYEESRAMFLSCVIGRSECLKQVLCLRNLNVNMQTQEGYTALMAASVQGNIQCLDILLATKGIQANMKDKVGRTALSLACQFGHAKCVERLLKVDDIDVNSTDIHDQTPLMLACDIGNIKCVKHLLRTWNGLVVGLKVDVNAKSTNGSTALIFASQNGHYRCVRHLLRVVGINVDVKNNDGMTPLKMASFNGHDKCVRLLIYGATATKQEPTNQENQSQPLKIINSGVDEFNVNDKGGTDGSTALMAACQNGHVKCVRILLRADGIDVNTATKYGLTAAMLACTHGHLSCLEELLQFGHARTFGNYVESDVSHEIDNNSDESHEEMGYNGIDASLQERFDIDEDNNSEDEMDYDEIHFHYKGGLHDDDDDDADGDYHDDDDDDDYDYGVDDDKEEEEVKAEGKGEGEELEVRLQNELLATQKFDGDDGCNNNDKENDAENNDEEEVTDKVNINATTVHGASALMLACMQGHVHCVERLIQYMQHENMDLEGDCQLCIALQIAKEKGHTECVDVLEAVQVVVDIK